MPVINESSLKKNIKNEKFSSLYFIYGSEKYLVKNCTEYIKKSILKKRVLDCNFHVFEGENIDIDNFMDLAFNLPMFGQEKLILINDLNIDNMKANDISKMKELISDLPDDTIFLISQKTVEIDLRKSSKWKSFITALKKHGDILEFNKVDDLSLEDMIIDKVSVLGSYINKTNAKKIIRLCGKDMLNLTNELEKLCAFVGQREIDLNDIEAVITKNFEATVFSIIRNIINRNYDEVYKTLSVLFNDGQEAIMILAAIASGFIDMYRVKIFNEVREDVLELKDFFDYRGKEFRISNAQRDSRRFTIDNLNSIIDLIIKTDNTLKTSRVDKKVIMDELITKIIIIYEGG